MLPLVPLLLLLHHLEGVCKRPAVPTAQEATQALLEAMRRVDPVSGTLRALAARSEAVQRALGVRPPTDSDQPQTARHRIDDATSPTTGCRPSSPRPALGAPAPVSVADQLRAHRRQR